VLALVGALELFILGLVRGFIVFWHFAACTDSEPLFHGSWKFSVAGQVTIVVSVTADPEASRFITCSTINELDHLVGVT
jgi:hypothetical protein